MFHRSCSVSIALLSAHTAFYNSNFLDAHSHQIVILKFSSPFCKACQMLKQKFRLLHHDPKFENQPFVLGDISVSNNPNLVDDLAQFVVNDLQVTKIPTLHFYVGGRLVETIVCGEEGCGWTKLHPQMVNALEEWGPLVDEKAAIQGEDSIVNDVAPTASSSWQTRIHSFLSQIGG
jgi:thiol-disulfide isomerase/thioredoxin